MAPSLLAVACVFLLTRHFFENKHSCLVTWPFRNLKNHRLTIKNPDVIFLLTNVAKTQDVLLDGTIFFGNTGQKDRATFMNQKTSCAFLRLAVIF